MVLNPKERLVPYTPEIRARIEACLPAKNKEDLLWVMFFGKNKQKITKKEALAYYDWRASNEMSIRKEVWMRISCGQWTHDKTLENIRIRTSEPFYDYM